VSAEALPGGNGTGRYEEKMMYRKTLLTVATIALAALAFAPAAIAAEAADDAGKPRLGLSAGLSGGLALHDHTDQASWSMSALYRPFAYGGLQMGYSDLGDDINGFHALIMPMLPVPGGITVNATFGVLVETGDDADRDALLTFGGGVMYDLPADLIGIDNFMLRFDFEHYDDNDDSIENFLVGFMYRFGPL
jgi:hypothetical protein